MWRSFSKREACTIADFDVSTPSKQHRRCDRAHLWHKHTHEMLQQRQISERNDCSAPLYFVMAAGIRPVWPEPTQEVAVSACVELQLPD